MSLESADPTVVKSVAITIEDLVSALETNRTSDRHAVLRITPPFSGRMRARLHVERDGEYDGHPRPVHVEPDALVEDLPSYPRPAETEDRIRTDPDLTYTVERHREYHAEAVDRWREGVAAACKEQATIGTADGPVTVELTFLGKE